MKHLNIISRIFFLALVALVACDPLEEDKPGVDTPPMAEQLDFTISAGSDDFHFIIENTSSVAGIANWDFGNGTSAKGDRVEGEYRLAGDYTITLTLYTNGGSNSVSKSMTQEKTDWDFFKSPFIQALSGGAEAVEGKTWVIDSLSNKHLGVGQPDLMEPNWWSASPLGKAGHFIYDDEFTFKLVGFEYNIDTHGSTHANGDGGAADAGITAGYYESIIWEDDFDKDVVTNDAARGPLTWTVKEEDDATFIVLSAQSAVLGYDGGNARKYQVLEWNENFLHVRSVGGAARYHKFIPKGYVKPTVTFEHSVVETGAVNTFGVSLSNVVIPEGLTVDNFSVDFGDGTTLASDDYNATLEHTYMRKGSYAVNITVTASNEVLTATETVTVAANHPDYVEFILPYMVMYNDFSEVALQPVVGEDCSVTTEANPDQVYPNKSAGVAFYSKTGQQWANANMTLPAGYRFDLRQISTFKIQVYGKAGDDVLLKLENTDRGGNAWQTGVELHYIIQADNTWEVAEYDFAGVGAGWDWTGDIFTSDVTTDDNFSHDFYNIIRIMLNPGNGEGTHEFYFDELAGPHVEGLKSGSLK